jgi:RimJ/RimL family protein N-acetyltransferase
VPTLTDGVVTLGAQRLEDAPEMLRGRRLPEVEEAWFGTKVRDLDHARYLVEYGLARRAEEDNYFWVFAIRASVDGPLMGSVVIHHSGRGGGSVLNIWLLPSTHSP